MLNATAFGKGLALALCGGILGKVLAGVTTGKYRWVIGFAMVGRGEFAFYVANFANAKLNLFDGNDMLYAQLNWALFFTVLFGPMFFKQVLNYTFRDKELSGIQMFTIVAQ